ncbi:MAG: prepilin-type N-terminal cleavage/methylation domain-containing protein [Selenomonadales bacterium]|nr:prepilin-type N-terminal cleavage/methylation domain-containing protein [Selenomonadales bacterium]
MSACTRLRRRNGFTLVEVLVSVAMLGILVLPLMGIFTQSLRSVHAGRAQVTAAFHAQRLMDDFVLADAAGRVPLGRTAIDGTFSFERAVRTHPGTGLTEVVITVFWQQGAIARTLRVVSLVAPR